MKARHWQLSAFLLLAGMLGCVSNTTAQAIQHQQPTPEASTPTSYAAPKRHLLTIYGYNYTDRYIDDYRVNGQGGGNLDLSTETAGGGGSACCVGWLEGSKLPKKIEVIWAASYCMQRRTNSVGETRDWREPILHIADLEFNGPVPKNPKYFEVHFYKDGHIELAMTEQSSWPRLKLPHGDGYARPGSDSTDPPCPPDYERVKAYNNPIRVDARPKPAQGAKP